MNQLILNLRQHANIGSVVLGWNDEGKIDRVDWAGQPLAQTSRHKALARSSSMVAVAQGEVPRAVWRVAEEMERYFGTGEPIEFNFWEHVDRAGWTEFQEKVYRATCVVPHGETRTYAWAARKIGQFGASRAVGQALRRNPLPILVPCHRIVATGALGGFMGASDPNDPEMRLKKALLDLEHTHRNPMFSFLMEDRQERQSASTWASLWSAQPALLGATV